MSPTLAQAPSAPAPTPTATVGEPAAVLLTHRQSVRFEADGRRTITLRADVQINTPAGLEEWSSLDLLYSSERQTATLVSLEIVKPSGDRLRPANLEMEDRRASGIFEASSYQDLTVKRITVPSLAVGDRLLFEHTIADTIPEIDQAYSTTMDFPSDGVIREAVLEVDLPANPTALVWTGSAMPAAEQDAVIAGRRRVRWLRRDIRPLERVEPSLEALMHEPEDIVGADVIVSSYGSWQSVGQWYRRLLDDVRHERAPLAAKARELTASATSDEQKLFALYRFVARDVRYVSLAFGIGRYQPRSPALVLDTLYGDCKDKHLLLAALAREVGLTIDPVLIGSVRALAADAPSPSQFDHLISVWRRSAEPSQWLWLDSTSGLTKPGVLLPNLRDKKALLVADGGVHEIVTTMKDVSPDVVDIMVTGILGADGAQTMTVTRRIDGDRALIYRLLGVEQWGPDDAKASAKELLATDGLQSSTITTASFTSGDDPWGPLEVRYTATVKYALASSIEKKALWVSTPSFVLPDPEKIGTPWRVSLEPAGRMSLTMTYTLPEGWQVEPPVNMTLTQPFARYTSRYTTAARVLKVERVLEHASTTLDGDARPAYTLFRKSIQDDRGQQVGLRIAASVVPPVAGTDDLQEAGRKAADAGQLDKARELFEKLTTERPDHPSAWLDLGRVYVRLSQLDPAQKAFERQIMLNPLDGHAYNHLGMVLTTQGRPTEAEAAFRKQIEVSPLDKFAHRNLGVLLLDAGRREEAVTALETAASVDRQDAFSRVQLGRAYLAVKAQDKAVEAFEAAVAASSPNPFLLNEAAWWLAEHDVELSRARVYAERGIAAASGTVGAMPLAEMRRWRFTPLASLVRVWDTRGWIAFKEGDLSVARTWLEAAYVFTDSSEVAWHVGLLREREGRRQAALEAYGRAASALQAPKTEAIQAVKRLEQQGLSVPGGVAAADLKRRQTVVRVPPQASLQQGEIVVSMDIAGSVSEVETMSGAVPAALPAALKAIAVPGSEVAKARQVRLVRTGSVECQSAGTCTIIWHRLP